MITLLKNERGMALAVLTMLIAILASMTGAALLFSRIDLMISGNYRTGTGALYAADAGVGEALNQLKGDMAASKVKIPDDGTNARQLGDYSYRSGKRIDSGPQLIKQLPSVTPLGFQLGSGTQGGYVVHRYEIWMTGMGPLNSSARVIQAMGQYGPVPN